ncbi:histidine phosphatase family protein [Microbacterium indicum]|uniref:histidine phosphatase family protein n=1 Tax=Microbacterium indicum TaxID=358100 RepID=UPI000428227C|nr:histidine phosphatase family protein [Microbacterium indicum]
MTVIALVRHGETEWNRLGKVQGSSDIPLNDTGRAQAAGAAAALRGGEYELLVASPLSRARETAEIIGSALGLGAPELVPDLRERGYGDAEGMAVGEWTALWPGGAVPGIEPREDVVARSARALHEIAERAGERPVIAVAHGAVISSLLRAVSDEQYPLRGERIGNASQQILDVTPDGMRVLSYIGVPI